MEVYLGDLSVMWYEVQGTTVLWIEWVMALKMGKSLSDMNDFRVNHREINFTWTMVSIWFMLRGPLFRWIWNFCVEICKGAVYCMSSTFIPWSIFPHIRESILIWLFSKYDYYFAWVLVNPCKQFSHALSFPPHLR